MEEVPAFVWREEIADVADGLDELIEGPGADAPEVRLEFREGHFDRVEIRAAGRQEQEVAPMGLEHPRGGIAVVGGPVVEDDHGPWVQFRDQDFFDAAIEGIPIQGSGDQPRCHDPIARQACDQGPVVPSPKRRAAFEPFTAQTAPVFAGHPGVGARLIQKDQPLRLFAHGLLSTAPVMPCFSNLWLAALPGDHAFFIYVVIFICNHGDAAARRYRLSSTSCHGLPKGRPAIQPE